MPLTFIDTDKLPRLKNPKAGDFLEILNKTLCGAENVVVTLHWLGDGQSFDTPTNDSSHQLYYLMAGHGVITLNGRDYEAKKGMGTYLGPKEQATFKQTGSAELKLLHLTVPKISH